MGDGRCCERDRDGDGNCDRHPRVSAPAVEIDTGPWCENCGGDFNAPERPCPQPSPGEPYKQCGRGGHMFTLKTAAEGRIAAFGFLPDDWGGSERPSKEARDLASMLVRRLAMHGHQPQHVAPMADGGIGLHYLRGDRTARLDVYNDEGGVVVVTREKGDDKSRYLETTDDAAVEEMCRFLSLRIEVEVERLRVENGRLDHELVALMETAREHCESLKEIAVEIERHLPETDDVEAHGCDWLARIANAGAVIDATATARDQWRRLAEQRLSLLLRAERSRDTWKAKAKRLEAERAAALLGRARAVASAKRKPPGTAHRMVDGIAVWTSRTKPANRKPRAKGGR